MISMRVTRASAAVVVAARSRATWIGFIDVLPWWCSMAEVACGLMLQYMRFAGIGRVGKGAGHCPSAWQFLSCAVPTRHKSMRTTKLRVGTAHDRLGFGSKAM